MFTIGTLILIAATAWYAARTSAGERMHIFILTNDEVRSAVLRAAQDVKLSPFACWDYCHVGSDS